MPPVEDSIQIAAPAETVFDAVSHLEQMGQYSPENTGGSWRGGASGPALGAKFRGTNAAGAKTWSTMAVVTEFDRPRAFAFDIRVGPVKVARWRYQLEDVGGSTKLTESWLDQRSALSKKLSGSIRPDREAFTRESIATTLATLKAHLEA
jgi:hypothetical protein